MSIAYAVGNTIIPESEYLRLRQSGWFENLRNGGDRDRVDLAGQSMSIADVLAPGNGDTPFVDIAFGKPLTAEIRWIYTGEYPHSSWGQRTKDVLISSAFKSIATYNEAPRAVNLLRRKLGAKTDIRWSATDEGTPLAFYTAAVVEPATFATFEVIFDNFPDEVVTALANAISSAGSIPVFAAQKLFFLAASTVMKLLAKAGHTLFDGDVVFSATEQIAFAHPGDPPTPAGWRVLYRQQDRLTIEKLSVGPGGQLLENGKPYSGNLPYVVISLDGTQVDKYAQFTPTAASAALLEKFYGAQDKETQTLDVVIEALKVYSDFQFRRDVETINKAIKALDKNDPKYDEKKKSLEDQRAAASANILHDELKPDSDSGVGLSQPSGYSGFVSDVPADVKSISKGS